MRICKYVEFIMLRGGYLCLADGLLKDWPGCAGIPIFFLRVGTLHPFSDVFLVGIIVTDCGTESAVMMGDWHDHDCPLPCRRHR